MIALEKTRFFSEALEEGCVLPRIADLILRHGHIEDARLLGPRVDAVTLDAGDEASIIFMAQRMDRVDLFGEMRDSIGQPMGQRRISKASVSPGSPFGDPVGLEQHDVSAGIRLLRMECGPKTCKAPADDD